MYFDVTWLHNRATKYNLSALGTYLVTVETFVDQRSRRPPPSMVYTTLENALDQ